MAEILPQEECGLIEYPSSGSSKEKTSSFSCWKASETHNSRAVGKPLHHLWGSHECSLTPSGTRGRLICVAGWLVFCDNPGAQSSLRLVDSLAPLASTSCCSYSLEQWLPWLSENVGWEKLWQLKSRQPILEIAEVAYQTLWEEAGPLTTARLPQRVLGSSQLAPLAPQGGEEHALKEN